MRSRVRVSQRPPFFCLHGIIVLMMMPSFSLPNPASIQGCGIIPTVATIQFAKLRHTVCIACSSALKQAQNVSETIRTLGTTLPCSAQKRTRTPVDDMRQRCFRRSQNIKSNPESWDHNVWHSCEQECGQRAL